MILLVQLRVHAAGSRWKTSQSFFFVAINGPQNGAPPFGKKSSPKKSVTPIVARRVLKGKPFYYIPGTEILRKRSPPITSSLTSTTWVLFERA